MGVGIRFGTQSVFSHSGPTVMAQGELRPLPWCEGGKGEEAGIVVG